MEDPNNQGPSAILAEAAIGAKPLAAITPPIPVEIVPETKYYSLAERNASMHRTDGSRLAFMFGVLATKVKADIEYLEKELAHGHPVLSRATPEQVKAYNMRVDPRGTIAEEMRPAVEASVRAELEDKIRKELIEKLGIQPGSPQAAALDSAKLGGSDALQNRLAALKGGVKSGTGTVIMSSQPAPLQGIVGSDKLAGAAADSVGAGPGL